MEVIQIMNHVLAFPAKFKTRSGVVYSAFIISIFHLVLVGLFLRVVDSGGGFMVLF